MLKFADDLSMSFNVPDSEKKIARESAEYFSQINNLLSLAEDHLDIIYNPFSKYESVNSEYISKKIGALNRFKEKVKENFEKIKSVGVLAVNSFNYFELDTKCGELLSSFKSQVKDLEKSVITFLEILDQYESNEFRENVLKSIENVKKDSSELQQLIKDRILEHIDENILGKNWINNISEKTKQTIKQKIPAIVELYQEQNKVLNDVPDQHKRPQSLNPTDTQKIWYPQDLRNETLVSK